jgi:hypothetical protein
MKFFNGLFFVSAVVALTATLSIFVGGRVEEMVLLWGLATYTLVLALHLKPVREDV